jgi:hypothetical protein
MDNEEHTQYSLKEVMAREKFHSFETALLDGALCSWTFFEKEVMRSR